MQSYLYGYALRLAELAQLLHSGGGGTVKQLRKLSQAQCNNLMGRTALVMWPKLLHSVKLDHTITSRKEHLIAFFNQFMQFPIA